MGTRTLTFALLSFLLACAGTRADSGAQSDSDAGQPNALADAAPEAPTDVCGNGLDDDGDMEIDEGCPCTADDQQPCYAGDPTVAGVGACTFGVQVCESAGPGDDVSGNTAWGACEGSVQPSEEEQCDGADDDCDGAIDEGCPLELDGCSVNCNGAEHIQYNATYDLWVKVVLCSPERYDILLGETQAGPFYKIGDLAGGGQDHCELVDPSFTLPNEDDINSGTCSNCRVDPAGFVVNIPQLLNTPMYTRDRFGNAFDFTPSADFWAIYATCFYECGVSF